MAFCTQKLFFNVPFGNEKPVLPDRKRSDCQLKSYESCTDMRAWSLDPSVSSKFLLDVVHKARFQRKLSKPTGGQQLTRAYLQHLSVEELVDYVMSLMMELEQTKSKVKQIEGKQKEIIESCEQEKEELILLQQRSVVFDPQQLDPEMIDLRNVLLGLKEKAERYDSLKKENKRMKQLLCEYQREEKSKIRKKTGAGACGDTNSKTCEKLLEEARHYKQLYEEIKDQKRSVMERLQLSKLREAKFLEVKNQLVEDEYERRCLQKRVDDLLVEREQQAMELKRKEEYIALCNRRLEKVETFARLPQTASTVQTVNQPQSFRDTSIASSTRRIQ